MFSDIFGGKNTFIHNELIHLKDEFEILYLALEEIPNDRLKKSFSNFKIIPYKEGKIIKKLKWWLWKADFYLSFRNRLFAKTLKQVVDDFSPEVIHLQFGYEALKFLDNYYDVNQSYIIHFHGYGASALFRKKSYLKRLKYYLAKKNISQIHVSNFIKTRFENYALDTSRVSIIKCGVDLSIFTQKEFKTNDDEFIFTQVSSQVEKKGVPYTIKGFALFQKEFPHYQAKLFITGEASLKNKQLITDLNLEHNVLFTGLLNHQEVQQLLKNTDIFIHPSITSSKGDEEGIPTAIMEAIACGLPVISTKHAGIPELVTDELNAILVHEKDALEIKSALYSMIRTPLKKVNTHQYLKVKCFDLDSHLQQISSLYNKLSNSRLN